MHERSQCHKKYNELCQWIPSGVNSPVRAFKGLETTPLVVESGSGAILTDVDGNQYIDYCQSWGALLCGHAHPRVVKALEEQLKKGTSFGVSTAVEGELAEMVVSALPSVDKVRFVSSGTEATMSAIRLARAYTKRDYILKFVGHYHGHADAFLVQAGSSLFNLTPTSSSAGVPSDMIKHTINIPFNDVTALKECFESAHYRGKIAAVIVEPIAGNLGVVPGQRAFLEQLREITASHGSLLIFDEVITGFRVGWEGVQGLYGIIPDLTCLGKIIGGGMPAAAFGGRAEIMDLLAPNGAVFQAGTLSGNPMAMQAGLATLKMAREPGFYDHLEQKARRLTDPIEAALLKKSAHAVVQRVGSMLTLFFGVAKVDNHYDAGKIDQKQFGHFFRHMLGKGIYLPPSPYETWFVSSSHTEEQLDKTAHEVVRYVQDHL